MRGLSSPRSDACLIVLLTNDLYAVLPLMQVLSGQLPSATLMALNASDPQGADPDHGGPLGIVPLMWRAMCVQLRPFIYDASSFLSLDQNTPIWY